MRVLLFAISFQFLLLHANQAQEELDSTLNNRKFRNIILAESVGYTGIMTGLHFLWYKDNQSQNFTFFNDNQQWLQMDKIGHAFTAYQITELNYNIFKNSKTNKKKVLLISSLTSTAIMLPIEIFDGFSKSYGASWGDALANTIGSFLPYHQLLFDQQYIYPKFSASLSPYAQKRPNILGGNYPERLLKDYNGQTYWLSTDFNIFSKQNHFPDWLQFSLGYSGNNMVYGNMEENEANGYRANRQFLFSLDFNLSKIQVEQKWLKIALNVINRVKIPCPTVEWDGKGLILHPFYF